MAKSQLPTMSSRVASLYPEGGPGRHLKARLKAGEVLVGGIMTEYARPSLMKIYRHAGFDFVYIEYEHVMFGLAELADTVLAARDNGLPVIAKTPQLERQEVSKLVECGVSAIQLPRTESREQLETLLGYMKVPPAGTRAIVPGVGSSDYTRPSDWRSWMADQDEETTLVVHIETRLGYQNAEEIVSTPGVDMVYVGPGDSSVELGHPGNADHPNVAGPMEEVLRLCQKYSVPFGTTASGIEAAGRWISKGAQFFETEDEIGFILSGASRLVREYHDLLK